MSGGFTELRNELLMLAISATTPRIDMPVQYVHLSHQMVTFPISLSYNILLLMYTYVRVRK